MRMTLREKALMKIVLSNFNLKIALILRKLNLRKLPTLVRETERTYSS